MLPVKMTPVPADGWADLITEPSSRQPFRDPFVMEIDWLPDTENMHHRESNGCKKNHQIHSKLPYLTLLYNMSQYFADVFSSMLIVLV